MWRNSHGPGAKQDWSRGAMRGGSVSARRSNLGKGCKFVSINQKPLGICCRDEAERLGRALGCKLLRTSVKEDIGVMSVFRHLASRCLHEMRRSDDDYQDDLRLYSAEPRSPSVISTCRFNCAYTSPQYSSVRWMTLHLSLLTGAFSPDGSMCGRNAGNGTIILRPGGKTKSHKKRNFVKNACRLL